MPRAVRRATSSLIAVLLAAVLAGCAADGARPAAGTSPESWLPAGAVVERNVSYGTDSADLLDVYRPAGARQAPVIVMVHGGGWRQGDKANASVVQNKVAHYLPAGYVFVSIDYPLTDTTTPPQQAQDVADAVAFVQAHAAGWGGDGHRVVLMGHSAGANLVSLVAADPGYAHAAGAAPWLGTVSLDSAAYNVPEIMQSPHLSLYDPVFGADQTLWRQSSPTLDVSGTPLPALLVCSTDRADSCPQARGFAQAMSAHGGNAQVSPIALTHAQLDSELGTPGMFTDTVDTFISAITHA